MQENLARGLQVVSRAVSARSTLPVLSNVVARMVAVEASITPPDEADKSTTPPAAGSP